ncbi:MAG: T9SS type A sorting domain-containing protein [Bacteroidales bacterium]|jgi:hypothetical protein|nr:T9SS type A sorting domain-containing protein [Bacteroidales bacterium]
MKKIFILNSAMLLSTFLFAYEWDRIGPANLHVNNFNVISYNLPVEILCTSNGILIHEGDDWNEYTYSELPAWNAVVFDPNNVLVILGNGSYSDGVYKFNLTTHEFEIIEWFPFPNFLEYCEYDNAYYAGSMDGMWKSTDGLTFTLINYFDSKNCHAFAWHENHFVVTTVTEIHCSEDGGETWFPAQSASPIIQDMAFQNDGKLYGVFPSYSNSSGLWYSDDYGESWSVDFYSDAMRAVGIDIGGNIFLGWEEIGIARWIPATQELVQYFDGLPNLHINKITKHPEIDTYNIVACTENGAYILTDYLVGMEEIIENLHINLSNYPNPFKGTTTVHFSVNNTCKVRLSIYNSLGEELTILFDGMAAKGQEYRFELSGSALSEGMYYCRLQSETEINAMKKMVCVK